MIRFEKEPVIADETALLLANEPPQLKEELIQTGPIYTIASDTDRYTIVTLTDPACSQPAQTIFMTHTHYLHRDYTGPESFGRIFWAAAEYDGQNPLSTLHNTITAPGFAEHAQAIFPSIETDRAQIRLINLARPFIDWHEVGESQQDDRHRSQAERLTIFERTAEVLIEFAQDPTNNYTDEDLYNDLLKVEREWDIAEAKDIVRPTAVVVGLRNDAVFLVRFKSHSSIANNEEITVYGLPGGKLDNDQTEEEAAYKEFIEETGMLPNPRFFRAVSGVWYAPIPQHGRMELMSLRAFVCTNIWGTPASEHETTGEWVLLNQLPNLHLLPNVREVIAAALQTVDRSDADM